MKTDFQGVSGHIHFNGGDRPGTISVVQYFSNETRLVGRYVPGLDQKRGKLDIYQSKLRWLTPGGIKPTDGNPGRLYLYENLAMQYTAIFSAVKMKISLVII